MRHCVLAFIVIAGVLGGCERKPVDDQSGQVSVAPAPGDAKVIGEKLAKADALDGKIDKVVSRCFSCALGMDGTKDHIATTAGYTLYFCSEPCKKDFEKDPGKAVMAMTIPEK